MPDFTDKRKPLDTTDKGLEEASISRPAWALDHACPCKGQTDTKGIPKDFVDAILEVVAKSIEQALADVLTKIVGECVAQQIHPLAQEIALLRIAIEHDWDSNGQRRRRIPLKTQEESSDG